MPIPAKADPQQFKTPQAAKKPQGFGHVPTRPAPSSIRDISILSRQTLPNTAPMRRQAILNLQRTIGNRATGRLLQGLTRTPSAPSPIPVQKKLIVGQPDDAYEREADAAASRMESGQTVERISRLPAGGLAAPLHRQPKADEEERQTEPVQRKCESCREEEDVQRQTAGAEPALDTDRAAEAMARAGGGSPLEPAMQSKMERGFGADFSDVRVHTGGAAREASDAINARAFSHGSDIYMGRGGSPTDHRLMAHELTHTLQQGGADGRVQRDDGDDEEGFFDAIGDAVESVGEAIGDVVEGVGDAVKAVGAAAGALLSLSSYPKCATVPARPPLGSWLDNTGLESIRHEKGQFLSRGSSPDGDGKGATHLLKQALFAWGCETYGLNLLPKNGVKGYFGPEAASALKQFQVRAFENPDGVLGPDTLEALDAYMGVIRPPEAPDPSDVGGDTDQGESTFKRSLDTDTRVARIYFPTDGDSLDANDNAALSLLASHLTAAEDFSIEIRGFADKRETAGYNLALADRRALSVLDTLATRLEDSGVPYDPSQYDAIPLGEIERPQPGETSEELKAFRRVDVWLKDVTWNEDKICPPREEGEEEDSAAAPFTLKEREMMLGRKRTRVVDLIGFTADDESLGKASAATLDRLAEVLDPHVLFPRKVGAVVECWGVAGASVFGYTECNEAPSLGRHRAESIAGEFPEAGMVVGEDNRYPAGTNRTAEDRRRNRSAQIQIELELASSFDFSGDELDALLELYQDNRSSVEGVYSKEIIELADLLASGADDRLLDKRNATAFSKKSYPTECPFINDDLWTSGRESVGKQIVRSIDADALCNADVPPNVDDLMKAVVEGLHRPMIAGIKELVRWGAFYAISSHIAGCPCVGLLELKRRSQDDNDIYHALRDYEGLTYFGEYERCDT